jgi:hypothetical protein
MTNEVSQESKLDVTKKSFFDYGGLEYDISLSYSPR